MTRASSPHEPRRLLRSSARCGGLALFVAACSSFAACGPRGASPIPQPPVLAVPLDHIGIGQPDPTQSGGFPVYGKAGSAPAGALLRLTDLDLLDPPAVSTVAADGSFVSGVRAEPGDEIRFEFEQGGQRSAPTDAIFLDTTPNASLMASPRFACLDLTPGFVMLFSADGLGSLALRNTCGAPVSIANARTRLALPDFALQTALPLNIPSDSAGSLELSFTRRMAGEREDVLFVDVTLGAETIRYPVTLSAPP